MKYWSRAARNMAPYIPGKQPKDFSKTIKLNTNECPYPPTPNAIKALKEFNYNLLPIYPDAVANTLRDTIARKFNLDRSNVFCGNGSTEILTDVFKSFTDPGDIIAIPYPNYTYYETLSQKFERNIKYTSYDDNFNPDWKELVSSNARMILFSYPNAPTGKTYTREEIVFVIENFPGLVIMDEAYVEFCDEPDYVEFVNKYDNLLIIRTLSKAYALASLRVGYALGNESLIQALLRIKCSYNINSVSQIAACAVLEDDDYYNDIIKKVQETRDLATDELSKMGYDVLPSQANFILCKPPSDTKAKDVYDFLNSEGIFIRYFDVPVVRDYIRISIGTPDQMQRLISSLIKLHKKQPIAG